MSPDRERSPELPDADQAFVAHIRDVYQAHPHLGGVANPPTRERRRFLGAAAAVAVMTGIALAVGGLLASGDDAPAAPTAARSAIDPDRGSLMTESASPDTPRRRLISTVALAWPHQTIATCSEYRPGSSPEVIYVGEFTEACLAAVPFGASAVFSSTSAEELGGIGWEDGSESWTTVDGVQVYRKVRGEEMQISSRVIQGIWTRDPREYAVYFGHAEAAEALDAWDVASSSRAPDGASE